MFLTGLVPCFDQSCDSLPDNTIHLAEEEEISARFYPLIESKCPAWSRALNRVEVIAALVASHPGHISFGECVVTPLCQLGVGRARQCPPNELNSDLMPL